MRVCSTCQGTGKITRHNWATGGSGQRACYTCYEDPNFVAMPVEPNHEMLEAMNGVHGQQDSPAWYQAARVKYRALLMVVAGKIPKAAKEIRRD